ncbi:hypothetical protein C8R44DRAFT_890625 [Mycena epipterygia]|nr:hypothetical protein C8R44DRAFT_890625 [Mycena epipterygia]
MRRCYPVAAMVLPPLPRQPLFKPKTPTLLVAGAACAPQPAPLCSPAGVILPSALPITLPPPAPLRSHHAPPPLSSFRHRRCAPFMRPTLHSLPALLPSNYAPHHTHHSPLFAPPLARLHSLPPQVHCHYAPAAAALTPSMLLPCSISLRPGFPRRILAHARNYWYITQISNFVCSVSDHLNSMFFNPQSIAHQFPAK